jgi:hypothetical protein
VFPAASKWYTEYRLASQVGDEAGVANALKAFNKLIRKFPHVPDIFSLYGQILMEVRKLSSFQIKIKSLFTLFLYSSQIENNSWFSESFRVESLNWQNSMKNSDLNLRRTFPNLRKRKKGLVYCKSEKKFRENLSESHMHD